MHPSTSSTLRQGSLGPPRIVPTFKRSKAITRAPEDAEARAMDTHDVVWMRKDPPFNMDYIFNTYLLDLAQKGALVVNAPDGLRAFNEKAWTLGFPDLESRPPW